MRSTPVLLSGDSSSQLYRQPLSFKSCEDNMKNKPRKWMWIPLTNGKKAKIDKEDYVKVSKYKWHNSLGYAQAYSKDTPYNPVAMHRLIMNDPIGFSIDHINHNRLDNRKCNLRFCNMSQNIANSLLSKINTSGYKGVDWHKGSRQWRARITINGKRFDLGNFKSIKNAAEAYNKKAKKIFGEFALLNKINLKEEESHEKAND
jgi:hypothetical protein